MLAAALTIAGSDPSGGAGLQADLKIFHRFGVYGEALATLITVQNTCGVRRIEVLAPELVEEQIRAVLDDIPPHAVKTGALGNARVVEAVARALEGFEGPLVVDPVMESTSGATMTDEPARRTLVEKLLPRASLVMPNLEEAAALASMPVDDLDSMARAAEKLRAMGARNVLVKGGHLKGEPIDLLLTSGGDFRQFTGRRSATRHTHGTGCVYSAAITAHLALGWELAEAIQRSKNFVSEAIRTNPGLGRGNGPLNMFAE
jgi:hydroxymethylpyrimidine/phosphomethylpyrimidine kinase